MTAPLHFASPVGAPIHPYGWVRPAGNLDWVITQRFSSTHLGIDIWRPNCEGQPVYPAAPGIVSYAGWLSEKSGLWVAINHGEGWRTDYRHLSRGLAPVGATVLLGKQVALVGKTGIVTGAHLHFCVKHDTTFVDPWPLLAQNWKPL